ACAVPVVATRVTGIPEAVLDGVTGRLIEPGNAGSFAAALGDLLADPPARERMGKAARERAGQLFDLRRNLAAVDAVLRGEEPAPAPMIPWPVPPRCGPI